MGDFCGKYWAISLVDIKDIQAARTTGVMILGRESDPIMGMIMILVPIQRKKKQNHNTSSSNICSFSRIILAHFWKVYWITTQIADTESLEEDGGGENALDEVVEVPVPPKPPAPTVTLDEAMGEVSKAVAADSVDSSRMNLYSFRLIT